MEFMVFLGNLVMKWIYTLAAIAFAIKMVIIPNTASSVLSLINIIICKYMAATTYMSDVFAPISVYSTSSGWQY